MFLTLNMIEMFTYLSQKLRLSLRHFTILFYDDLKFYIKYNLNLCFYWVKLQYLVLFATFKNISVNGI